MAVTHRAERRRQVPSTLSQSEKDWAFAKRSLARGDPQDVVIADIEVHRRFDKHNPRYYAELTVKKAADSLNAERVFPHRSEAPDR